MIEVPLGSAVAAWADDEDSWVLNHRWFLSKRGYAVYHPPRDGAPTKTRTMHREILGLTDRRVQVDHINRNKSDNRRQNLRLACNSENCQNLGLQANNTSGYRGVVWHKQRRKWVAQLKVNYRRVYLGLYDTPEEANEVVVEARAVMMPFSNDQENLEETGAA